MYPTFSKLVAAILFAGLAWQICGMIEPRFPQGRGTDLFLPVTTGIAAILGWRMLGSRAVARFGRAAAAGVSTGVVIALAATVLWAFAEVMRRALRGRYGGVGDALEGLVDLALAYGRFLRLDAEAPLLIVGSALVGIAAAFVRRMEGK